jgi:signal transduction histidine kinase
VVKEVVDNFRSTLLANIELVLNIDIESVNVQCNPVHLQQVVTNLCTNAQHAMREFGGLLTVDLKTQHLEPNQADLFASLDPGDYVKLTVSDTGHGIDRETIRRIFDPYFTTKEKDLGTGLGLAVVHGIVKNYGGTIKVSSLQGQGTTFTVFLPSLDINQTGPKL